MEEKTRGRIKGELFLLLTAIIWGASFVSQKLGMENNGPFSFSFFRLIIGSIVLIPVIMWQDRVRENVQYDKKTQILAGIICGAVLFFGVMAQQLALKTTTSGKTAFITALYIVLVPIGGLFLKKRVSILNWIAVLIGAVGLYFLSISGSFQIASGDVIVFIGSFFWAAHILLVDHFVKKVDPIRLSMLQFLVAGILSGIVAFAIEQPSLVGFQADILAILFSGIIVVGVAFTLQILGQQTVEPSLASILMSFEAVFAVFFGWLILHEMLTMREILGSALMFIAILLAQKK